MSRAPKVLVTAAGVTGVAAYGLPQPWSFVAAVADLLLVGLAGVLWLRAGRGPEPSSARREVVAELPEFPRWIVDGPGGDGRGGGYPQPGEPGVHGAPQQATPPASSGAPVLPLSRRRRRWPSSTVADAVSSTSRVRRQFRAQAEAPPSPPGEPVDVHRDLANLETLVRTTNERGQRAQLWFFFAGVAVSIPAGIVVNLLTD
ncbi:hypothetical protein ACSNOB_24895 [Micromonospora sp. URMC 106]|uniref:hypothetical protein n=1 Tax=Micromonospora sp. URMC 106 TaxID=3423408 RepID=UPI003F1B2AAE